jgi:hypothetical protein
VPVVDTLRLRVSERGGPFGLLLAHVRRLRRPVWGGLRPDVHASPRRSRLLTVLRAARCHNARQMPIRICICLKPLRSRMRLIRRKRPSEFMPPTLPRAFANAARRGSRSNDGDSAEQPQIARARTVAGRLSRLLDGRGFQGASIWRGITAHGEISRTISRALRAGPSLYQFQSSLG